ncbi:LacI family DNA-binding transcriptional regulator [Sphingomonas aerolata]|uniref:LacI family DNA-binding transcriptional regulator n=1 Tax=Sphingomonas aerolata TaxID=185951 RepID=UPI002FE2916D
MPTIIEVAAMAGVSTATVSRVLSRPDQVSEKTRLRVLAIVRSSGYAPNVAARSLRTLRAAKILLTVPDISNPFFASVIRGAEEAARDAGYSVVVGDTRHDSAVEDQYADMLSRREVDGLIFLGHRLPDSLASLLAREGAPHRSSMAVNIARISASPASISTMRQRARRRSRISPISATGRSASSPAPRSVRSAATV